LTSEAKFKFDVGILTFILYYNQMPRGKQGHGPLRPRFDGLRLCPVADRWKKYVLKF
jgi:hypothetical protein